MRRTIWPLTVLLALALIAGCSGSDDSAGPTTPPEAPTETLRILLANDDGIEHPGLDLMVRRLSELPDVELSVVAPSTNRSGSGDNTTDGTVAYTDGETASGFEGTAVDGYPADIIAVALDELGLDPHVVVSGVNDAHNIGPVARISGTVGVVRTAVGRGIPGVAGSAGLEYNDDEFGVATDLVADWITEHRDALVDRTQPADEAISFNVPTCDPDDMGELVEVPLATEFPEDAKIFESNCDLANTDPANDYEALKSGYPAMTRVPVDLEPLEPAT